MLKMNSNLTRRGFLKRATVWAAVPSIVPATVFGRNGTVPPSERIILAAKSEFAERGFDGARMGSIAKTAGVNQALIHYYFGSKRRCSSK